MTKVGSKKEEKQDTTEIPQNMEGKTVENREMLVMIRKIHEIMGEYLMKFDQNDEPEEASGSQAADDQDPDTSADDTTSSSSSTPRKVCNYSLTMDKIYFISFNSFEVLYGKYIS